MGTIYIFLNQKEGSWVVQSKIRKQAIRKESAETLGIYRSIQID